MASGLTISIAYILIKCTGWVYLVYIGIIDTLNFKLQVTAEDKYFRNFFLQYIPTSILADTDTKNSLNKSM